jgi:hypothetical protein
MTQYEVGDLLLAHERRIEKLEDHVRESSEKLARVDERTAIISKQTSLMFETVVPKRKRADSDRPPHGDIAIKTKWGSIRGGAPWVALVLLAGGLVLWLADRMLS